MRGIRQDGSTFDLEFISFPTSFGGRPVSQTHIRNITQKKQLEEHLIRTEKLASLGQLAAGVAHEMDNPLGSIMVFCYLLLEDLDVTCAERAQVEKIVKEATRCKEIVKGLLEFSRYMPSRMVPVQVGAILEEVLSLVGEHLLFQHIDLVKDPAPDLPPVLGDKNRMEQVFIDLLMNCADAMGGMGRLTVSAAATRTAASAWPSRTPAPASPRAWSAASSTRSSPPRGWARAWGWAYPSPMVLSRNTWDGSSWKKRVPRAPPSSLNCPCTGNPWTSHIGNLAVPRRTAVVGGGCPGFTLLPTSRARKKPNEKKHKSFTPVNPTNCITYNFSSPAEPTWAG